jgi:hypothetical protein
MYSGIPLVSKRLAVYPLAAETGFGKHVSKSQTPRNERTTHVRNDEGHEKSLIGRSRFASGF